MALSKHIDPENLIEEAKEHRTAFHSSTDETHNPYGARYETQPIPKYKLPKTGIDAKSTYQLIHDELSLDGTPILNLAGFIHTWMPPEADKLMMENISKNLVDQDEYPMSQVLHTRCISILADLWHAPAADQAIGTATTGSSEAVQLGGLAMKKIWQAKHKAAGKSIHEPGPNIVMGANAQVALEKFARYFDVEMRLVPVSEESQYRLDPKKAMEYVNENTIGVYIILGSTYTGHYEPVKEMADLLDEYEAKTGISVPIHVDAASGGFVAPFATPKHVWDFRIPRVVSINVSGHKFGLCYVGVGWIVWRSQELLPKELIFELHYLGSVDYSFSLSFSRPAHPIIAQYFNFVHLGFEGYRKVAINDLKNARLLSRALEKSGYFEVLSDIHRPADGLLNSAKLAVDEEHVHSYVPGLPLVAFRFSKEFRDQHPNIKQKWVQTLLRAKGWIVPNYELPPNCQNTEILRVVVKENLSAVMVDRLVADIIEVVEGLEKEFASVHELNIQHSMRTHEGQHGKLKEGSGGKSSGTYAKQC